MLHAIIASAQYQIFRRNWSPMPRGKPIPVVIGSITFPNQSQALSFFKKMLSKYSPEDVVSDEDSKHLAELVKRHPEYSEKLGNGLHHFEVMRAEYNSQCFGIVRRDGSRVDVSYKVCVRGRSE